MPQKGPSSLRRRGLCRGAHPGAPRLLAWFDQTITKAFFACQQNSSEEAAQDETRWKAAYFPIGRPLNWI